METILFFIKRKKLLKDGTASIFVRVTFGRLSAEVATGKSVLPSQWVATKGRAKGNTLKTKLVNAFLDQMEYTLHDLTLQIQREGKQVSAKEILSRYKNLNVPKIGILALYAEHNQEQKELIGISVAQGTYILTEKWAGLSFKNGPPERAYKVNKIMRRCHCSDLVFNHLLSLFEPV